MSVVIDRPGARIEGPTEPTLLRLWRLAISKHERQTGQEPQTAADWKLVAAEYVRLLAKRRGGLGQVIQELQAARCHEVPEWD